MIKHVKSTLVEDYNVPIIQDRSNAGGFRG